MSFRITHISTRVVSHTLREDRIIVSAAGCHDASSFLTVGVEDENGTQGFGEAATTALWSGETARIAQIAVEELFAPLLIGHRFDHPCEALQRLDAASWGNPFSKAALDTALWDVWAKNQNAAVTDLICDRKVLSSLPTRASVGCYDPQNTVRIARAFWDAGIKILKFKVGVPPFDDAARLKAVRDELGPHPIFTLDANGAYANLDDALRAMESWEHYDIRVLEQPAPRERNALLAQIKQRSSISIMADEAVWTREDLQEVLDLDACDIVSLYPGKNGGFTHALDMAKMVFETGKYCALGSNLETDLGQAAMLTLAATSRAFPEDNLLCDAPAALFYRNSSLLQPLPFNDGEVQVPTGPGFGVTPRDNPFQ